MTSRTVFADPPTTWRCPSCSLTVELFIAPRQPPSHRCRTGPRRGHVVEFVLEEESP